MFPHFLILSIFENVETSLYRNVSTFLNFVYFLKVWKHFLILSSLQYFIIVIIPHFLILPIFENVETSLYRDVSTFLDFAHFFF